MNAYLKRENLRVIDCEFGVGEVAQKPYGKNSSGELVWGCIRECPYIWCEYNLNPNQEALRYNIYGRTEIW